MNKSQVKLAATLGGVIVAAGALMYYFPDAPVIKEARLGYTGQNG